MIPFVAVHELGDPNKKVHIIMVDWQKIRNDFPVTQNLTYFQSAGMSPIPNPVLLKLIEAYMELGAMGDYFWHRDLASLQKLSNKWAEFFHTTSDNIGWTSNTSTTMSLIALAFKRHFASQEWNIISMEDEFPSSTVPFEYQNVPIKYVASEQGRYPLEKILAEIDPKTVAVVTSFVQYSTGFRQDLFTLGQELKKRNILFIVNATQGVPFFPVNVNECAIDALTVSLHKWGLAGHIGCLFYTSAAFREKFPTPIAGWLSLTSDENDGIHLAKGEPLALHPCAQQYSQGTFNLQVMYGLQAAFDYLEQIGWENIRKRIFQLSDLARQQLEKLPVEIFSPWGSTSERSAILSFGWKEPSGSLACYEHLVKNQIQVAYRNQAIRVSFNIFNNEQDVDCLIHALNSFRS